MASKWQYASLPASERISRVRSGDKDVYESEIARAMDVISLYKNEGRDTKAQEDWIDTVSYNYNLHNAEKMGINSNNVNKSGYADLLLGKNNTSSKSASKNKPITLKDMSIDDELEYIANDYLAKASAAKNTIKNMEEWLLNNGIDKDSVDGKRFLSEAKASMNSEIQKYKNEYTSKLKQIAARL